MLTAGCCVGVVAERDVKVLTYLTTRSDRAVVLNVICSLLNTVSSDLLPLCLDFKEMGPIDLQHSGKDRIANKDLCPLPPSFEDLLYSARSQDLRVVSPR